MADDQNAVFELLHVHVMPDGYKDFKSIGFYRTEADAREANRRAVRLDGTSMLTRRS